MRTSIDHVAGSSNHPANLRAVFQVRGAVVESREHLANNGARRQARSTSPPAEALIAWMDSQIVCTTSGVSVASLTSTVAPTTLLALAVPAAGFGRILVRVAFDTLCTSITPAHEQDPLSHMQTVAFQFRWPQAIIAQPCRIA